MLENFTVVVAVIIITIIFRPLSQILPKAMFLIFSNFQELTLRIWRNINDSLHSHKHLKDEIYEEKGGQDEKSPISIPIF